ncbi:MAG: hypothetical protein ACK4IY_00145 [Chitinophagales bacterium]
MNSPYSRIGLGNYTYPAFAGQHGMAGVTTSLFLPNDISYQNPASYSFLLKSNLDLGIVFRTNDIQQGVESTTTTDGAINYIAFGFSPDNARSRHDFGFSVGLVPYAVHEYQIETEQENTDTLLGLQQYQYTGNGGVLKSFLGIGYSYDFGYDSLKKSHTNTIGIGINTGYLFGRLSNETIASFPDQVNSVNTKLLRETQMGGTFMDLGLAYQAQIGKYYSLNFGLSGNPTFTISGKQSLSWFNIQDNEAETITDTLYFAPDSAGTVTFPSQFHAGVTFNNYRKTGLDFSRWLVSLEYSQLNWEEYRGFQYSDSLVSSYRLKFGAELLPPRKNKLGETKLPIAYRAGFYYGTSYLEIYEQQLSEFGITFGLGLPARGSKINFAFQYGYRGNGNYLQENIYNFYLGFNLFDANWFFKRKIN